MQLWFFYAVILAIFVGLSKFLSKIISHKKIDKNNFILYLSFTSLIINFGYFLYTGAYFYMTFLFGFLIILRTILVTEKVLTMVESLKYIDTSLFFPANHLIKIAGGLLIGMFLFGEYLNLNEIIFLIFGIISVIFLGYKKGELQNKDLKKGIYFLVLSSLFLIGTSTINKYIGKNESIPLYMFLCSIASIIYILFKMKIQKHKFIFKKTEFLYGILSGIVGFLGFVFYLYSLVEGKLVVVQLISTLTTLIPIVLSFIFLNEHINKYRIFGLVLFLINLGVFYIGKYGV